MMTRKKRSLARAVLLLIVVVCLVQMVREYSLSVKHKKEQEELASILQVGEVVEKAAKALKDTVVIMPEAITGSNAAAVSETGAGNRSENSFEILPEEGSLPQPVIMDKYTELYAENNDLAGWLSIPGMVIDYPVMQCEDNEYYLHHNYYGEEDKYGCLFVKDIADINTPGTNFIIYGHNMKDGSMFGDLDEYREKSFYEEHSKITFDTLYEERTYEIMAVFLSHVYKSDEEGFRYYQFYQADTEEEFNDFYENVMEMALYETGITAEFGDTFLTLSTCAYHEEDGRLVVVAKWVDV
ncbi:MAG: class B sortase [Lachnospiraceae bacterium]|nr:class B sortase [Lachnospiraceae bacterium]